MSNSKDKGKGLLAVILLIPLAFIIYFAVVYSSQTISLDNVNKITVSAPSTDDIVFESKEDIDFFVKMFTGARQLQDKPARDITGEKPVYITLEENGRINEYKFYPSLNLSGCMLVSENGDMYVLEQETAKEMSLRNEFGYLYSSYFLPELSVVSGENRYTVDPLNATWNYYKSDDVLYEYVPAKFAAGDETYPIVKGLDNCWEFETNSNKLEYEITEMSYITEGGTSFNIKNISALDLSSDTVVTVSFKATWSSRSGARAFGEAEYKFNVLYDVPASIELEQHDIVQGDVLKIYASNLNSDELLSLESLLDVPPLSFGSFSQSQKIALVPIGLSNTSGEYPLIFHGSGEDINESITVSERETGEWKQVQVTKEQYDNMFSLSKLDEFNEIIASVTAERPENEYFVYGETEFCSPISTSSSVKYKYGQYVNIANPDISGDSGQRLIEGVVYNVDTNDNSVRSVLDGEVVYSGVLAPTGNTVIIYHGCGIYSYYYHLADANVQLGAVVGDGEVIGTAGENAYSEGEYVLHFAVSIDGTFVDPMWFYTE